MFSYIKVFAGSISGLILAFKFILHIIVYTTHPDSPYQRHRSHYPYSQVPLLWLLQIGIPLRVLCGYAAATVTEATAHAIQ